MEINALTRVSTLLEAHPELEEPLIAFVPAFAKLRNPILRATVSKLATLEHAAKMGGLPLPELVDFLRQQLGQERLLEPVVEVASLVGSVWPAWYREDAVVAELDVAALLATGSHPLAAVKQALVSNPPGAIVVVTSDFEPAPLLAQMAKEGILVACIREGALFRTCLRRP